MGFIQFDFQKIHDSGNSSNIDYKKIAILAIPAIPIPKNIALCGTGNSSDSIARIVRANTKPQKA